MAYIGNDLQVAYQSYQIIDDISGSFNGSTTSFALLVGGVTPVPFPINEQQCLISVGGVIQEPDPTGTNGFRFSGGNIVFSSAPNTGEDFFGVILAGADYVNAGVKYPSGSESAPSITFDTDLDTGIYNPAANELGLVTNGNDALRIDSAGNVTISGSISKGSGSFKITHPLETKKDTHYLVHSFIEGPQADLIYRGHVQLFNGIASVNIDEAARMTEGTFEALCTNVCCFTSNESDWTAVRGSVSGNILTIEAQDQTSTADVCWIVVGERKDQHMLHTDWTDENGRVITELLKSEVDSPEES